MEWLIALILGEQMPLKPKLRSCMELMIQHQQ
jgi:hypothetical protein